jgi:hypothetical protein
VISYTSTYLKVYAFVLLLSFLNGLMKFEKIGVARKQLEKIYKNGLGNHEWFSFNHLEMTD